jgi:hypothetical protein
VFSVIRMRSPEVRENGKKIIKIDFKCKNNC